MSDDTIPARLRLRDVQAERAAAEVARDHAPTQRDRALAQATIDYSLEQERRIVAWLAACEAQ